MCFFKTRIISNHFLLEIAMITIIATTAAMTPTIINVEVLTELSSLVGSVALGIGAFCIISESQTKLVQTKNCWSSLVGAVWPETKGLSNKAFVGGQRFQSGYTSGEHGN